MSDSNNEIMDSAPQISQVMIDLGLLERKLKSTKAIGFLKKLHLKSEIEDLINEVKHFHNGQSQIVLDDLENRFNHLIGGIQSLVKAKDLELAEILATLKDDLWDHLADPEKFVPAFCR